MTCSGVELLDLLLRGTPIAMPDPHSQAHGTMQVSLEQLQTMGLQPVVTGGGRLTLAKAPDVLDLPRLKAGLETLSAPRVETLRYAHSTASTNTNALAAELPASDACGVYLAEYQSAGQGRRGKRWSSPFASGLCVSLSLRMPRHIDLARLPLALGVGLRRALMSLGVRQCQLKWPNDLIADGGKLGGILINARQLAQTDSLVVAGLGLNIYQATPRESKHALEPIALTDCLGTLLPDRTTIAIALINAMRTTAHQYSVSGFDSFAADWPEADFLHQREIRVLDEASPSSGVVQGIDEHGRLLLQTPDGVLALSSGEVSVRPVNEP